MYKRITPFNTVYLYFLIINMNIVYYVIFGLMQHSLDNNMASLLGGILYLQAYLHF